MSDAKHDPERVIELLEAEVERLRAISNRARNELGVPGKGYAVNVANAYRILEESDE